MFHSALLSECERKQEQLNFLLGQESVFSNAVLLTQDALKRLEGCSEIKGPQKEVGASEHHLSGFNISGIQVNVPHGAEIEKC